MGCAGCWLGFRFGLVCCLVGGFGAVLGRGLGFLCVKLVALVGF